MSWFKSKKEIQKTEPTIVSKSVSPITEPSISISMFPGFGTSTASGVTVTTQTVLELSAAYACINFITTDISKVPVILQQEVNGGWKAVKQHPIKKLLKKPNKRDTLVTFLQTVVFSFLVSGNGYVAIIRDSDGSPIRLIPLDYNQTYPDEQTNGDIFYKATSRLFYDEVTSFPAEEGITRTFRDEDMIHIRNFNMYSNVEGRSPVQLAGEVFGLGLAAQESAARAFQNGSYFQGYLKVEGSKNL